VDDKRLIFAGIGLLALLASCMGCAGLFALGLHFAGENPVAERDFPDDPMGPIAPPNEDPRLPPDRDEQRRQMRARYRPGPHVEVEGMLPSGRLEVQRMQDGSRDGRTVDTPWIVGGAELHPAAAPSASDASAGRPTITHADGSQALSILAGVPARLPIRATAGAGADSEVRGLYIAFHDYPGHFFLPATVDTELGQIRVAGVDAAEVIFGLDAALAPGGEAITSQPLDVTMYVAAVDIQGRVSPYLLRTLRVMPVGTGDVEVTVTMTRSTDLDLYVVDASGNTVYYGNQESASGGHLDLDANAACSGNMGVDNEHIFWAQGTAPSGTYTVRVAHYESCINNESFDYRVTVENCGETVILAGHFDGAGNSDSCDSLTRDDPSWCQQVVEFEVTPCDPSAAPSPTPQPAGPIGNPGRVL
jgi:hypothetical protein